MGLCASACEDPSAKSGPGTQRASEKRMAATKERKHQMTQEQRHEQRAKALAAAEKRLSKVGAGPSKSSKKKKSAIGHTHEQLTSPMSSTCMPEKTEMHLYAKSVDSNTTTFHVVNLMLRARIEKAKEVASPNRKKSDFEMENAEAFGAAVIDTKPKS
eukprot:jgi/Bigna1/72728/fgenesh1_pg.21_\